MSYELLEEKLFNELKKTEKKLFSPFSGMAEKKLKKIKEKQALLISYREKTLDEFLQIKILGNIFQDFSVRYQDFDHYIPETVSKNIFEKLKQFESIRKNLNPAFLKENENEQLVQIVSDAKKIPPVLNDKNQSFYSKMIFKNQSLFSSLNQEQKEAVLKEAKHHLVIAGAGSGKTTVLLRRIIYLIQEKKVSPEKILALTYTKNAASVMEQRIEKEFGLKVKIKTFHAFAYEVFQSEISARPKIFTGELESYLSENFDLFMESPVFSASFFDFLLSFYDEEKKETDFQDARHYQFYLKSKSYQTLRGEIVKSKKEKKIADFLFLHHIDYQTPSIIPGTDLEADFYLKEASFFIVLLPLSSHRLKTWQKLQKEMEGLYLLEESDSEETLFQELIKNKKIKYKKMSFSELKTEWKDYSLVKNRAMHLFASYILNFKTFQIKKEIIEKELQTADPRTLFFLQCAEFLRLAYEKMLLSEGFLDFSDLIQEALKIMRNKTDFYSSRYSHILVDEFQDISLEKIELLKLLALPSSPVSLFCVGDDWQSIYSFNGSEVSFFTRFEKYFFDPEKSFLSLNYRCPKSLIDAGNRLLDYNNEKIEKKVKAFSKIKTAPVCYEIESSGDRDFEKKQIQALLHLIHEKITSHPDYDILILSRYNRFLEMIRKNLNPEWIKRLRLLTVHRAKGDEADLVIILGMNEGSWGFPSTIQEQSLLKPVRPLRNEHPIEEERRLFYVALTRARKELFLFTPSKNHSIFISEIEPFLNKEKHK